MVSERIQLTLLCQYLFICKTGYSGGALKHGPFALIESDENGKFGATPIIMLIFDDDHAHHMRTAAEEVKARGADVIIITDKKSLAEGLDDDPLVIPSNGPLTALGAVLPIQLMAFELAMMRWVSSGFLCCQNMPWCDALHICLPLSFSQGNQPRHTS